MQVEKQILKLRFENKSQRQIALSLKISRNTVSKVFKAADQAQLYWDKAQDLDDKSIHEILFPDSKFIPDMKKPDFDYVHKELLKPGVTLSGLWEEYVQECKDAHQPFYHRSYFFSMYQSYVKQNNLTMHINHKPGDKIMVDWDGKTLSVFDRLTGEEYKVYLFVATLPFSMYSYVQPCMMMKQEDWIQAHINMYNYFGGVSRILVPDNLKTGVTSHKKYDDPVLNKAYQEMADHYGTTIIPARVRKPKDKAAVEGSVGNITNHIISRLRNRKFFDIATLNNAVQKELNRFNENPFQKREGSRKSVFLEEEVDYLLPLPAVPFEISEWKTATVQLNYHIQVDKMNYSVPYEYVGKRVEVRMTKNIIEVFYKGTRISSHRRLYGRKNQYSTMEDHMPKNHKLYQWNAQRFQKWAVTIGPSTYEVITKHINRYKVEEQSYKGCLSLLKLSDRYTAERLERACQLALEHISIPSYKNIRLILESGQDLVKKEKSNSIENNEHAFVRGSEYYGGKIK